MEPLSAEGMMLRSPARLARAISQGSGVLGRVEPVEWPKFARKPDRIVVRLNRPDRLKAGGQWRSSRLCWA